MKKISLIAPRKTDDPVHFDVSPGEALYAIFNKPGVRSFTTTDGIRIELNMENL